MGHGKGFKQGAKHNRNFGFYSNIRIRTPPRRAKTPLKQGKGAWNTVCFN